MLDKSVTYWEIAAASIVFAFVACMAYAAMGQVLDWWKRKR